MKQKTIFTVHRSLRPSLLTYQVNLMENRSAETQKIIGGSRKRENNADNVTNSQPKFLAPYKSTELRAERKIAYITT